jgi:hypothetical protein
MSTVIRLDNLGPIADKSKRVSLENKIIKGYANLPTIVPEDYFFMLAIEIPNLFLHFGDAFGGITFLAAIYHPTDINDLPTGFLLMDTTDFLQWLYPDNGQQSAKPEVQKFCFSTTADFIKHNEKIDQIRSESIIDKTSLKSAVSTFVSYFIQLKNDSNDSYRGCLGIQSHNQPSNSNVGKQQLSEAEKQALEAGQGPKRSVRIGSQANISYKNKVPLGAIHISSMTGKRPEQETESAKTKKQKVNAPPSVNPPPIVDLRTRGQKSADTKAANKLAEEARIKEAINKQLQQQVQQLQKTMQPQPQFNQAVQIPKGQQQSYQPQSRTSEQYRSDMCLDFKMFETAVTSFESFADRRLDKFVSTSK